MQKHLITSIRSRKGARIESFEWVGDLCTVEGGQVEERRDVAGVQQDLRVEQSGG